jgi:hypothetical protein
MRSMDDRESPVILITSGSRTIRSFVIIKTPNNSSVTSFSHLPFAETLPFVAGEERTTRPDKLRDALPLSL